MIAGSGKEALQQIQAGQKFDLVIMDFGLPGMDGMKTTRQILSLKTCKDVIIIGFSADSDAAQNKLAFEAGMREVLLKQISTLKADIMGLVQRLNIIGDTARNKGLHTSSAVPAVLDISFLNRLESETDRKIVLEVIALLMQSAPKGIKELKANLANGKMLEAVAIAHPLKSSIATLGGRLKNVMGQLEDACKQKNLEEANRLIPIIEAEWPLLKKALKEYVKSSSLGRVKYFV